MGLLTDLLGSENATSLPLEGVQATEAGSVEIINVETANAARGPFQFHVYGGGPFDTQYDPVLAFGYNNSIGGGLELAGEPAFFFAIESHYDDSTKETLEAYWSFIPSDGSSARRPIFWQIDKGTDEITSFQMRSKRATFTHWSDDVAFATLDSQGLVVTPRTGESASLSLAWVSGGQNFLQIDNSTNGLILQPLSSASATWQFLIGATQAMSLSVDRAAFAGQVAVGHLLEVSAVDGVAIRVQDSAGSGYSMLRFKRTADTQYRFRVDDGDTGMDIKWGIGGASATDTSLGREAAGVLGTPAKFHVGTDLEVDGALDHDGTTAGFYGTAPVAKPTGVAVTAADIHAALVTLGLIAA